VKTTHFFSIFSISISNFPFDYFSQYNRIVQPTNTCTQIQFELIWQFYGIYMYDFQESTLIPSDSLIFSLSMFFNSCIYIYIYIYYLLVSAIWLNDWHLPER